jgi:fatty acid desaturase
MSSTTVTQQNDLPGLDTTTLRNALGDLHRVQPWIYWLDFSLSALLGWSAFALAVKLPLFSGWMLLSVLVSVAALYRAVTFIHELSHHRHHLKGFEWVWNLLIGYEMFLPSFTHAEPHLSHHRILSFGTENDPEYLPFAHSPKMILLYAFQAILTPPALAARFLLLAPSTIFSRKWERWLIRHASSFTFNPRYQRDVNSRVLREARFDSLLIFAFWGAVAALVYTRVLPLRTLLVWWIILTAVNFVNTMRTLAAHAYDHDGVALTRNDQWADSIDAEWSIWSELWAPVGLTYHAVHHFLPGIPYHNLPQAHRRLSELASLAAANRERTRPGIFYTLRELIARARSNRAVSIEESTH